MKFFKIFCAKQTRPQWHNGKERKNKVMKNEKKATRQSYGEALKELGKENPNVIVLDSDLARGNKNGIICKRISR